jgi:hypothetical protein
MRARSDYAVSDNFAFGHRGDSGIPMTKVRLDKRRHFRSIVTQSPLTSDDVCVVDPQSPNSTLDGTRSCPTPSRASGLPQISPISSRGDGILLN